VTQECDLPSKAGMRCEGGAALEALYTLPVPSKCSVSGDG
jgi:hypothetical protein